jgi:taurine--2-oxoglutarate transaminase
MSATSSLNVTQTTARYTYGTWRKQRGWSPLHVVDADGCWFTDSTGRRYLDFCSQLMCVSLGYRNEAVIEAIARQARQLPYVAPGYATDVRAELAELLLGVLPQGLDKFFFTTSGTDANEAAFKIARMVTGRSKILARYRSYHGSTAASIAATGDPRRWSAEPSAKLPGVVFAPETNCYRCPLGHQYPACDIACASYIEHMIENEGDVAAILVEPVPGTNGVLVPPPEYLPRLREICDRHGVLLIADEVMTGWGRTGAWFAVDHWGVKPDILVTAKGLTSAYTPLGLCATTRKIADYFEDHYFGHGHTYEAHALALSAAVATIKEMKRLDLVHRAAEEGKYLGSCLREVAARHASVGEVRGLGMFWAIDLVRDQARRTPANTKAEKMSGQPLVCDRVAAHMLSHGVAVQSWISHLVVAPPLIASRSEIDFGVEALDAALHLADEAMEDLPRTPSPSVATAGV